MRPDTGPRNFKDLSVTQPRVRKFDQRGEDLTESLLLYFKQLIREGSLLPGDRLPPERELAETIGVSRSSLRQALKVLSSMGLISQRVGSGTRLNPVGASILTEPLRFLVLLAAISPAELMEARLIVEPELAARAAERADSMDLRSMNEALGRMESSERGSVGWVQSDLDFHRAVNRAAGNRACAMLFSVVHESLEDLVQFTSTMVNADHTIGHHRRIESAIRRRDPEGARQAMFMHMEDASRLVDHGTKELELRGNRAAAGSIASDG
jgi:GntR family transcriptional repressor for pyruvate dehydrogenase complex